jgi:integrase
MKAAFYRALSHLSPGWRTLDQFVPEYLEIVRARPIKEKTYQDTRLYATRLCQEIGTMPICRIKPVHVSRIIRKIWESGRQNTAKRALQVTRSLFDEAINAGYATTNPAKAVKALPYHVKRSRLPLDLWQRMLDVAERHGQPWVPHMLKLALVTGQRRGDLLKMQFSDVWDGFLHVEQAKTGARIALPLDLHLDVVDLRLGDVIEGCQHYGRKGKTLLRRADNGKPLQDISLSYRFAQILIITCGGRWTGNGTRPSLHECRSLAERLYREQGIDTMTLLGHRKQSMTDLYHNDRGLDADKYKVLRL